MSDKLELFDDDTQIKNLSVNKEYAKKYEHIQKMKDLQRAKELEDSESDTSEEEDSDAEFLNDQLDLEMINVLSKIRSKDPSIYDKDAKFYDENAIEASSKKTEKAMTYKDLIRERVKEGVAGLVGDESGSEDESNLAPVQLQAKLKKAVISGLETAEDEDEDFMLVREKTADEEAAFDAVHDEFKKTMKKTSKIDAAAPLARYFGDDTKLSADDKFLKEFILMQGWKNEGKRDMQVGEGKRYDHKDDEDEDVDDEYDDAEVEAMEDYEHHYNFRYEQPSGTSIEGHIRGAAALDSVRKRDEKRKEARERKKVREQERKAEKDLEIRRLNNLRRQELVDRLKKIRQAAGLKDNEGMEGEALDFMTGEFDEASHDRMMASILGENYEDQADEEFDPESVKLGVDASKVAKKVSKLVGDHDEATAKELKSLAKQTKEELQATEEVWGDEDTFEGEDFTEEEAKANGLWFCCDGCSCPILPGEQVWECGQGCDFALCKSCHKKTKHQHKLIRDRVPEWAMPPENANEALAPSAEEEAIIQEMEAEEEHAAFDDIIGGDMLTRFKYRQVAPVNFGLTAAEILLLPDSEVNRLMPLRALAPYADAPSKAATKRRIEHAQRLRERLEKGEFDGWFEKEQQAKVDKKNKKHARASGAEAAAAAAAFGEMEVADDDVVKAAIAQVTTGTKRSSRDPAAAEEKKTHKKQKIVQDEEPAAEEIEKVDLDTKISTNKNKKEKHHGKAPKVVKNLSDERKAAYGLTDSGKLKEKVKKQFSRQ